MCFRLYSESDYTAFAQYSTPEIHRVPLDSLVLQMASLGLRDATLFPFIEPPLKSSLVNASYFLKQQNALTTDGDMTSVGRMLARLPVDIVIGKMLIMGSLFNMVDPVLVIAAALSVQSPLTKKFGSGDSEGDCEHRRKELFSEHGDPFTLLNAYDEWILTKSDRRSNSKKWCKRRGLEEQRFYEMSKLKRQFEDLLRDHGLLNKNANNRRSGRDYGERDRLRKLKREHRSQKSRKRKVLKLEKSYDEGSSESGDDTCIDINDIDFKLRHNLSKLEESSKRNRRFTYRDINLLKLVISSGLYPQVVLADESNVFRKESEQVFHSKDKQFLMLHPTGVYSLQPDLLESLYNAQHNSKEKTTEGRYGDTREFLVYVSLLETNKPYVVNTMKTPALQTLFLLSTSIDTNSDCTQIVFNEWIELSFDEEVAAKELLSKVIQLRKAWDTLLEQKLLINEDEDEADASARLTNIKSLEKVVSLKLAEFIDADITYKLRRVSSAELKFMYVSSAGSINESEDRSIDREGNKAMETTDDSPQTSNDCDVGVISDTKKEFVSFVESGKSNSVKGGVDITPFVTYGCLRDDLSVAIASGRAEYLREHYHCPKCEQHLICTVVERMKHDEICGITDIESGVIDKSDSVLDASESEDVTGATKTSREDYYCDECEKEYKFYPTEILKHKLSRCKYI